MAAKDHGKKFRSKLAAKKNRPCYMSSSTAPIHVSIASKSLQKEPELKLKVRNNFREELNFLLQRTVDVLK